MSLIGPRPLLVAYLPRYNEFQHHRHDVRPGLTGYAQAHVSINSNLLVRIKILLPVCLIGRI